MNQGLETVSYAYYMAIASKKLSVAVNVVVINRE